MSITRMRFPSLALVALLLGCPRSSQQAAHDAGEPDTAAAVRLIPDAGGPSAQHGAELYARMCVVCHGDKGQGYAADHAPSLAHPDFLGTVSDEFLSFAIAVGRRGTTMSAWQSDHGGPLSPADVRDVIAHLRGWQKGPPTAQANSALAADIARGKQLFVEHCERCHGAKGPYVRVQGRQFLVHARAPFLRHAINKGRAGTEMAAFSETLGEQGVEDVVAYLRDLPSWPVPGEIPGSSAPPPLPLGQVPLNPRGAQPRGFQTFPDMTSVKVVARELKRGARMVVIDARAPSDYMATHIKGAVSVPFYDPSPYLEALPKDAWIVCYCGCPHAESGSLAKQLQQAGFPKVTVLDEGLGVWSEEKHPLATGREP